MGVKLNGSRRVQAPVGVVLRLHTIQLDSDKSCDVRAICVSPPPFYTATYR